MTDGGQCVIMGLLSLSRAGKGGWKRGDNTYLMKEQQRRKNGVKMEMNKMKLR